MVRECTVYDFNSFKLVEISFMAQDMICLGVCVSFGGVLDNMYSAIVGGSINVKILLVEGVAKFFYTLGDFCLFFPTIVERRMLMSPTILVDLLISTFCPVFASNIWYISI